MIQNLKMQVAGKNGILHFAPVTLNLYGGNLSASSSINLRRSIPQSHLKLFAKNIQLRPLLQDLLEIDFFEGTVNTQFMLRMKWGTNNQIKKPLMVKEVFILTTGPLSESIFLQ